MGISAVKGKNRPQAFDLLLDTSGVRTSERRDREIKKNTASWYLLGIVGQIGFSIAIPIAGGAILGSFIDRRMNIYPKATLGLLLFGVFLSFITFYETIKTVLKGTEDTRSAGSTRRK